jgi:aldehyde:ferredoxin oxidoreductase
VCETQPGLNVEKAKKVYGVDNPHRAQDYDGKAQMVKSTEILTRVCNSFGVCIWNSAIWDVEMVDVPQLAALYSIATGWETSIEDLGKLAMKQLNLEKAFNLRFTDFDRKDDMPTPRDLNEPIPTGDLAGFKIEEDKWDKMLDDYYDLHGWDRKTSYPKRKTLVDLGLDYVADDLEQIGKLG